MFAHCVNTQYAPCPFNSIRGDGDIADSSVADHRMADVQKLFLFVFRDGIDNSYRSFIISDDDRKWWSILWTGDRVQADNLLDVAIDVWQSRLRNVLDQS